MKEFVKSSNFEIKTQLSLPLSPLFFSPKFSVVFRCLNLTFVWRLKKAKLNEMTKPIDTTTNCFIGTVSFLLQDESYYNKTHPHINFHVILKSTRPKDDQGSPDTS